MLLWRKIGFKQADNTATMTFWMTYEARERKDLRGCDGDGCIFSEARWQLQNMIEQSKKGWGFQLYSISWFDSSHSNYFTSQQPQRRPENARKQDRHFWAIASDCLKFDIFLIRCTSTKARKIRRKSSCSLPTLHCSSPSRTRPSTSVSRSSSPPTEPHRYSRILCSEARK